MLLTLWVVQGIGLGVLITMIGARISQKLNSPDSVSQMEAIRKFVFKDAVVTGTSLPNNRPTVFTSQMEETATVDQLKDFFGFAPEQASSQHALPYGAPRATSATKSAANQKHALPYGAPTLSAPAPLSAAPASTPPPPTKHSLPYGPPKISMPYDTPSVPVSENKKSPAHGLPYGPGK